MIMLGQAPQLADALEEGDLETADRIWAELPWPADEVLATVLTSEHLALVAGEGRAVAERVADWTWARGGPRWYVSVGGWNGQVSRDLDGEWRVQVVGRPYRVIGDQVVTGGGTAFADRVRLQIEQRQQSGRFRGAHTVRS